MQDVAPVEALLLEALLLLATLLLGLVGAIWAYAGATLLSAITWTVIARRTQPAS